MKKTSYAKTEKHILRNLYLRPNLLIGIPRKITYTFDFYLSYSPKRAVDLDFIAPKFWRSTSFVTSTFYTFISFVLIFQDFYYTSTKIVRKIPVYNRRTNTDGGENAKSFLMLSNEVKRQ